MVLGGDVGLEDACKLEMCALLGRFTYRVMGQFGIMSWMTKKWQSLVGYTLETVTLIRRWFCFSFRTPEDSINILQETWIVNGGSLMLIIWRVEFDPVSKYFQFINIWVLLPGLPIQF
jgi:hypothetical protein